MEAITAVTVGYCFYTTHLQTLLGLIDSNKKKKRFRFLVLFDRLFASANKNSSTNGLSGPLENQPLNLFPIRFQQDLL